MFSGGNTRLHRLSHSTDVLPSCDLFNRVYDRCLFSSFLDTFFSAPVYGVSHTSVNLYLCGLLYVLFAWLTSVHISAPYVIAGGTHETCCRQAGSKVTLDYVAVLDECCPGGHDSSLNYLYLDGFFSGPVSLSRVDVALNVLSL